MRLTKKLSAITSVLALGTISLSPAQALPKTEPTTTDAIPASAPIQSPLASLSYEKPEVTTAPAPIAPTPEPVVVQEASAPEAPVQIQAAAQPPILANSATTPAPTAPAAPVASSGKGAIIASAALAQLGIAQDCTALVSNALSAAGINFHGWPADYLSLGTVVSGAEAQPGDLIYYAVAGAGVPHIAVYIGNGQAVHGGFNGSTVVFSAYQGSGPVFIRV